MVVVVWRWVGWSLGEKIKIKVQFLKTEKRIGKSEKGWRGLEPRNKQIATKQ